MNKELRLIITRNCNYNCFFCHGEGVEKGTKELLNSSDYAFLVNFCKQKFGWDTVTLTGGEPFIRKDIFDIVNKISDLGVKITIVSNGELITFNNKIFDKIERINVSIHSLDEFVYDRIIQKNNKLKKVLANLHELRKLNNSIDIRINTTIVKQKNNKKEDYCYYSAIKEANFN